MMCVVETLQLRREVPDLFTLDLSIPYVSWDTTTCIRRSETEFSSNGDEWWP
jgi:hypothetical protein